MDSVSRSLLLLLLLATTGDVLAGVASRFRGVCLNEATEFYCVSDGKCIPRAWTCDDASDCSDGEDEEPLLCSSQCNATQYQCPSSKRCIDSHWLCDGMCNCRENCDDENRTLCASRNCSSDQFACGNGQCIDGRWKCDGKRDCTTGTDEDPSLCGASRLACQPDLFACADRRRCISTRWTCDGERDCADGSDESDAQCSRLGRQCNVGQFRCTDGSRCIPQSWRCDGDNDCRDGSDENRTVCASSQPAPTRAPAHVCMTYQFTCRDGTCISGTYKCDGDRDCMDGSDEEHCDNVTCAADSFKCQRIHQCIPHSMRCDGQFECLDHTDELDCLSLGAARCDSLAQFNCTADHTECIDRSLVCNNITNCHNGADERNSLCNATNPCGANNGGCTGTCQPSSDSRTYSCECGAGFRLDVSGRTCEDIDECAANPHICSHKCFNTNGSFACECMPGYAVDPAQPSLCKAVGERPYLLFANRVDIRQLRLTGLSDYTVVVDEGKSIVAMDVDSETNTVYYADSGHEVIVSAEVARENSSRILVSNDVGTVDGLAFDWIYKRIYWTDAARQSISATSIAHPAEDRVLLVDKLSEPRAIALYPHKGMMFFSDWGNKSIYSAGMDGEHVKVIISRNIEWPNGLVIDMVKDNIYWIDAKLKCIQVADFDGNGQRIILFDANTIAHPFAITVFEDTLYWSDWMHQHIASANKYTGRDVQVLLNETKGISQPMDLRINHRLQQPIGENHCDALADADRCSHMCYPALHASPVSIRVSCKCRQGFQLDTDRRSCVETNAPSKQQAAGDSSQESFSAAQLAAIVVTCTLLPVLGAIAILLLRRRSKNAKRAANFDNPVYHKTTDDKVALRKCEEPVSRTLPPSMTPLTSDYYGGEDIGA